MTCGMRLYRYIQGEEEKDKEKVRLRCNAYPYSREIGIRDSLIAAPALAFHMLVAQLWRPSHRKGKAADDGRERRVIDNIIHWYSF